MGRGVFQPGVFCICRRPAAWKVPEKLRWNWMPPVRAWHASSFTYIPMRVAAGSSKLRADFSALTKSSEDFETAEALRLELPRAPSTKILQLKLPRALHLESHIRNRLTPLNQESLTCRLNLLCFIEISFPLVLK